MTAKVAGNAAIEETWASIRRLKEQWLLVLFLTGSVLWVRDTYREFANLPALMRQQASGLAGLEATVTRLEAKVILRLPEDRSPVLEFPGTRHAIDDGVSGEWTVLHWRPVNRLRKDCAPSVIDAWMIDGAGRWFSVETSLSPMPTLQEDANLAFGVKIHPMMVHGRANVLVQITFDCGTHRQVETAPWLQFLVLDN